MAADQHTVTYEVLRERLLTVVRQMHEEAITGPHEDWPGMLFVGDDDGLEIAAVYPLAGIDEAEKEHLARVLLPGHIRDGGGWMFAWVAPGLVGDDPDDECLMLIVGERGRQEAFVAPLARGSSAPQLGDWKGPAQASGLFVEPLAEAVAERGRERAQVESRLERACHDYEREVEAMVARLERPDDDLGPFLLLDGGASGQCFRELDAGDLRDSAALERLCSEQLAPLIARERPQTFALVLSVWAKPVGTPTPASGDFADHPDSFEQVSVYVGDAEGYVAIVADLLRDSDRPPSMSTWLGGPGSRWSAEYCLADSLCQLLAWARARA